VALGDICEIYQPKTITQQDLKDGGAYFVYGANGVIGRYDQFNHEFPEVIVTCRGATCGTVNYSQAKSWITGNAMVFSPKAGTVLKDYLYQVLKYSDLSSTISGSAQPQITRQSIAPLQIPLPPLEIQREIVAEIEGYHKVINGARAVLDNYRPHIPINPDWAIKELGEVCSLGRGFAFKSEDYVSEGILSFRVSNIGKDRLPDLGNSVYLPESFLEEYSNYLLQDGDFVIVMVGATTGKIGLITADILPALLNQNMWRFHPEETALNKRFLYYAIDQLPLFRQGGARDYLRQSDFLKNPVPLPPLAEQQAIVAEIEAEQNLVNANRELITRFEGKIQTTLSRIWGDATQ
jgi:type I restriction enzyme M protein